MVEYRLYCEPEMNSDFKKIIVSVSLLTAIMAGFDTAFAALDFLPPVRESAAYREYKKRGASELARILYMIDRCKGTKIQVIYDGASYPSEVAVPIARWFLGVYYRNQTAEQWIKQYCTVSGIYGNPIRVKLPDGTLRSAPSVLMDELNDLKQTEREDEQGTV